MWPDMNQTAAASPAYMNGGTQAPSLGQGSMPLDELAKRIEAARERATAAAGRIRVVADALFGVEAEQKTSGNQIAPPPNGRVASLSSQADGVHYWLGELEHQIARLNPLG